MQPETLAEKLIPVEIKAFSQLQAEFEKVYLLEDKHIVRIAAAFVIANKTGRDPLWLFLVGPSSGGKTEIISAIESLPFVHPIDTMTVNTFASGQKRAGKETSLLLRINTGILTFKDFTAILEMNKDARKEIMSQLRCIFDGTFVKRTGTGEDIKWTGKLGMMAAVTSVIHQRQQETASMGERFIMYAIKQPNRKDVQERIFMNSFDMGPKRLHLKECFKSYIENVLAATKDERLDLSDDVKREIIDLADFCTRARSGLVVSERNGKVDFIPDPEMPTRVTGQMITLAAGLMALNKTEPTIQQAILTDDDKFILQKIALDSIPRKRRQALQIITKYKLGATSAAVATELNYETEIMKQTLQELCSLGLARRVSRGDTYFFVLNPDYRDTLEKFEVIISVDEELQSADSRLEDRVDRNASVDEAFDIMSFTPPAGF